MDASFDPKRESGPVANPGREARRKALATAPSLDGLEDRQLLSTARAAIARARLGANIQQQRLRAARRLAAIPTVVPAPTFPSTNVEAVARPTRPSLGISNFNPIGRMMRTGSMGLGIGVARPKIPARLTAPVVPPTAPAATTLPTASAGDASSIVAALPAQPAADPADAALQSAVERLDKSFKTVVAKSKVTPELIAALRDDHLAIEKAATKPADADAVKKLTDDFKAVGDALPTALQSARIKLDVAGLVEARGLKDSALVEKTLADTDAVLAAMNLTADDLKTLTADLAAVQEALDARTKVLTTQALPATSVLAVDATATSVVTTTDLAATTAVAPDAGVAVSSPPSLPAAPIAPPKVMEGLLTSLYGPLWGASVPGAMPFAPGEPASAVVSTGKAELPPWVVVEAPPTTSVAVSNLPTIPGTATPITATTGTVVEVKPRPTLTLDRLYAALV